MFKSLADILDSLLTKHHGDNGISKKLDAIEKAVAGNTKALLGIALDVAAIKVFIGITGPPGTVTDGQVAETLAKVQAAQALVVKFNP